MRPYTYRVMRKPFHIFFLQKENVLRKSPFPEGNGQTNKKPELRKDLSALRSGKGGQKGSGGCDARAVSSDAANRIRRS